MLKKIFVTFFGALVFDLVLPLLSHPPRCDICGTGWETKTNEMSFSYGNGYDSPWEAILQDEKEVAFSY
jgi:hypothetical protein